MLMISEQPHVSQHLCRCQTFGLDPMTTQNTCFCSNIYSKKSQGSHSRSLPTVALLSFPVILLLQLNSMPGPYLRVADLLYIRVMPVPHLTGITQQFLRLPRGLPLHMNKLLNRRYIELKLQQNSSPSLICQLLTIFVKARESKWMLKESFENLRDFCGHVFSPLLDATRSTNI